MYVPCFVTSSWPYLHSKYPLVVYEILPQYSAAFPTKWDIQICILSLRLLIFIFKHDQQDDLMTNGTLQC